MISSDAVTETHTLQKLLKFLQATNPKYKTNVDNVNLNLVSIASAPINCCAMYFQAYPNYSHTTSTIATDIAKNNLSSVLTDQKTVSSTTNNHLVVPFYSTNSTSICNNNSFNHNQWQT